MFLYRLLLESSRGSIVVAVFVEFELFVVMLDLFEFFMVKDVRHF